MKGLIFDGILHVGTFEDAETRDGVIFLDTVSIKEEYVDIMTYKTKKLLCFMETHSETDSHIVAKDYGEGMLEGIGMWIDRNAIVFVEAKLIYRDKNAN